MRFFISFVVVALAAIASASSTDNSFNIPTNGYTFKVGEPTTLTWTPSTSGTVTLRLQWGVVTTANSGSVIASNIPNDGSYTWDVPSKLAAQPDYTIEIISDDNDNDYNFLPRFTVEGSIVSVSTSTASKTSSTSSESSSSAASTSASTTDSSSSSTASSTSASSSAASSSASQSAVPTTNAGVANRVSGGLLAAVAGAIAML
ncbi:hypothetical protein N7499_004176 [Penicillium canescens]|uniref:Yeast cell wall synthesis Kre9/Knh1-like N-terminal domain-containing protein n=1 Tax=Penicillium canescens TaxID=5083 RepID=A0AAD6N733_PENCN|nr:uncharacterized protein N7446_012131 [Penicillium canescens]KAJ6019934.1 hypothetical protein N7522_000009 [Penicillium canescens]KAJ6037849.1 hypothetical protein N7460_007620 [Penicillium canescens]KAJ6045267.1 hypothetical protein N7446_012131 [Penicillium canescens]KAJ6060966.1 hypothetical protein N7444_001662 [Penicillium canescens]KAJ6088925.1 hypothetical protein N7499_004176 [Penicillium canescens]